MNNPAPGSTRRSAPEPTIIVKQLPAKADDQRRYRVEKLYNTVAVSIGQTLSADALQQHMNEGFKVTVQ